ncbi:6-phosphogluconolactonase [Erythrobacter sanguineus]|uniref:6-phosphogluconolactonase n=1 Tax=Erythrobacter sanguineus TaxID=198312 RepID=A0A1M7SMR6_9SPHN|nr:6-phosphogluconolactonase [Erythrobacter sanguineus]SHN59759.1 6-phosphogluconolactonase [Erythrobacter sanguineus]
METADVIESAGVATIADWLDARLAAANRHAGGRFAITIPGGSTPFPILEKLVQRDPGPAWSAMVVWPNDDRIVPEDHAASNTGKMRALLEPAGAEVHALAERDKPPHFALTWLGMGPDGHIASLFPNTDPADDDPRMIRRLTPDPLPAHAPFDRITLTLPALTDTDAILFTLGGAADKRSTFEVAMRGEHDLPVARLLRIAAARGIPVTVFT